MIEGYDYGEYCEDKKASNRVVSSVFMADVGFLVLTLAIEAMGQPIF